MLDGILHVGPLDKYSKISSRTQVSNHKYFQSVIYLLHYLCLLCFESQHCTEDDVGELMLAGKEKATLVQLRNISAGLWSTNLDFLHRLNAVTAPERNNILITIVIAMITFHWLTSDCHHECIDPVTDDDPEPVLRSVHHVNTDWKVYRGHVST